MSNVRNARIAYAFIIPALTIFAVLWASNAAAQRGSTLIRLAQPIGRIGESVATAVATEFVMRQAFPKDPDTSTPAGTAAATTPTTPAPGPASSSPPSPAPVYPSPPRASTQPVGYLYILTWTDADGGSYLGNLYMYGPTGTLVTQ